MRHVSLLLFGLAAACSFPQHIAKKTVEDSFPAAGIRELYCRTHNGDITIHGKAGATEIRMRATLSVRGYTRDEAERNLELLAVGSTTDGDRMTLAGKYDAAVRGMSPGCTFVVEAPADLVQRLESHNGDIRAIDTSAALHCETHNGDIEARALTSELRVVTHNGNVDLEIGGAGALDGSITSHNGDVAVGVAEGVGTSIRASTHNGSIGLRRHADESSRSRRRLECRLGDGAGRLEIETHNGNVEIR